MTKANENLVKEVLERVIESPGRFCRFDIASFLINRHKIDPLEAYRAISTAEKRNLIEFDKEDPGIAARNFNPRLFPIGYIEAEQVATFVGEHPGEYKGLDLLTEVMKATGLKLGIAKKAIDYAVEQKLIETRGRQDTIEETVEALYYPVEKP